MMQTCFLESMTATGSVSKSVSYFYDYHPWHGGKNPNFNNDSRTVLDFKNGKLSAVLLFALLTQFQFNPKWENCCCVAVPSSNPNKFSTPIHKMIGLLVSMHHSLQDGSGVLVRTTAIHKLARGGRRDKSIHLESIKVNRNCGIDISGRDILLIDDVITTGNSLLACVDILKEGGAKRVFLLTLAKTV